MLQSLIAVSLIPRNSWTQGFRDLKINMFLQYQFSTVLNIDVFKTFIKEVYNLFDNPNFAINTLIEIFGHNYQSNKNNNFKQDSRLVLNEFSQNDDAKVKYVCKSEFMTDNHNNDITIEINKFNPDDHMKSESALIYYVDNNKKSKVFDIIFHSFMKFIM